MKTLLAATVVAVAIPSLALADQPRTLLEIRQHFAADHTGNDAKVHVDTGSTRSPEATRILSTIAEEGEEFRRSGTTQPVVSRDFSTITSPRATAILRLLSAEEDDRNYPPVHGAD